jgi:hypothetical protein
MISIVNHNSKVDPALRERRAIIELLLRVDKSEITYSELEGIAEELIGSGSQAAPVLIQEIAKTEDLDRLNKLTFLAGYLDDERIVEPLAKLLFHPQRSRAYKAQILQALERLGVDTANRFYQTVFRQREALRLNLEELRRRLSLRSEAAVQFLYDVFYSTQEQRMATAHLLLEEGDGISLRLAGFLAEISEEAVGAHIVEQLAHLRSADSALVLAQIEAFAIPRPLAAEAAKGLRRLRFTGVECPPVAAPRPERVKAWAGRVEGNGTQMLWLAAVRDEPDCADSVCFLLHESRGLIDCFGEVHTSLSQFIQTSVQDEDEDGGRPVSLDYALERIEAALALSQEQLLPVPPEYPFRIRCLHLRPLAPRKEQDRPHAVSSGAASAGRLRAEGERLGAEIDWKSLCELFDEPIIDDWLINDPSFFRLVTLFFERARFEKTDMERMVTRVYLDYVEAELPLLQQRLLRNAEWIRQSGGEAAVALRLETAAATLDLPHPEKNQFVQHYILRSVREAHDMLREGYDPSNAYDDEF